MNPQVYVNRFILCLIILIGLYTVGIITVCKFIFGK